MIGQKARRAPHKHVGQSFQSRTKGDLKDQWEMLERFCLAQGKTVDKRLEDGKQRTKLQEKEFPHL
ncbi:hypothetical protein A7K73_01155 [Candidatus Methylacidiphilum fumarolicum]|nr:hypothetical protein A7K73_01155 [Candidatus Methylacidiphilum fumarolicum]TFE74403.1 hypothetical protein A7D33_11205 [Candidatus Methylacidiphilum fumarolicum]